MKLNLSSLFDRALNDANIENVFAVKSFDLPLTQDAKILYSPNPISAIMRAIFFSRFKKKPTLVILNDHDFATASPAWDEALRLNLPVVMMVVETYGYSHRECDFSISNLKRAYADLRFALDEAHDCSAAVSLSVPLSLFHESATFSQDDFHYVHVGVAPQIREEAWDALVRRLNEADNVGILAGREAFHARDALQECAEKLDALVYTVPSAKGVFPEGHPRFVWNAMGNFQPEGLRAFESQFDLLLVLGAPLGKSFGFDNEASLPDTVILVDPDARSGVESIRFPMSVPLRCKDFLLRLKKTPELMQKTINTVRLKTLAERRHEITDKSPLWIKNLAHTETKVVIFSQSETRFQSLLDFWESTNGETLFSFWGSLLRGAVVPLALEWNLISEEGAGIVVISHEEFLQSLTEIHAQKLERLWFWIEGASDADLSAWSNDLKATRIELNTESCEKNIFTKGLRLSAIPKNWLPVGVSGPVLESSRKLKTPWHKRYLSLFGRRRKTAVFR